MVAVKRVGDRWPVPAVRSPRQPTTHPKRLDHSGRGITTRPSRQAADSCGYIGALRDPYFSASDRGVYRDDPAHRQG